MKTDVLMATYNSERYLQFVLKSVSRSVPVNRLIVVDHYSTDGTLKILRHYGAEIYSENVGLGYARQLAIDKSETDILTFIDSDLVLSNSNWWYKAYHLLDGYDAIVGVVDEVNLGRGRKKYYEYWLLRGRWMTLGSTLIRRECLNGIEIPPWLGAHEDMYLQRIIRKKGFKIRHFRTEGAHFCDYTSGKSYWRGANARLLSRSTRINNLVMARIWQNVLSCLLPFLVCGDLAILTENVVEGWKYLKGWLEYDKYRVLDREFHVDH